MEPAGFLPLNESTKIPASSTMQHTTEDTGYIPKRGRPPSSRISGSTGASSEASLYHCTYS